VIIIKSKTYSLGLRKFGVLDFAVNNAGILGWLGNINTVEESHFNSENDAMQVNYYGTLFCMHQEIKHWLRAQRSVGVIVNVASVEGLSGFPGSSLYCASKHAIVGLTQSLAGEFSTGKQQLRLRINAVAPGPVNTQMVWDVSKFFYNNQQHWEGGHVSPDDQLWLRFKEEIFSKQYPGTRVSEPWEITSSILFLTSHYSDFISGSTLVVDNTMLSTAVKWMK